MNPNEIKRHFPNASQSLIEANALGSELPIQGEKRESKISSVSSKLEPDSRAGTLGKAKVKKGDSARFLVRVTSVRKRLLDEDNLCEKYVVDCCRYAGLLPDDCPGQTKIEVCQRKPEKEEGEGTLIEIFEL